MPGFIRNAAFGAGSLAVGAAVLSGAISWDTRRIAQHPPQDGDDPRRVLTGLSMLGLGLSGATLLMIGSAGSPRALAVGAGLLTPVIAVQMLHLGDRQPSEAPMAPGPLPAPNIVEPRGSVIV